MISQSTKKNFETWRKENEAAGFGPNIFAYIYGRISDEDKDEDYSIPRQLAACREYCEQNGITVLGEFHEERSSWDFERRKEFSKMLDGMFKVRDDGTPSPNCCVCLNYSRFAREVEESKQLDKQFTKAGKAILSCSQDFGNHAMGRSMRSMTHVFDEYQILQIADDTFECMTKAARTGKPTGKCPYGLKIVKAGKNSNEKRVVIDKEKSKIVRYLFNSVDQGLSYDVIRAHLQSQGIKTTTGKSTFSNGQLNFMLTNPAYKGIKCYCSPKSLKKRGRVTLLTHDPIYSETLPKTIEPDLFDRVQRILAERRIGSREGLGLDGKYVLKQTLFCSCGRAMHGMAKKNRLGKPTDYYHCPDHKRGDNPYCAVKDVNKKYVEHAVFSLTDAIINSPAVQAQVTAKLQSKAAELKRAVQKAQDAVDEESEKQINLVKQLAKGWGAETEAMIEGQIKQVIAEKERLGAVQYTLHERLQSLEKLRSAPVPVQKTATYGKTERRKVVNLLVESATADNGKVTIRLRT